MSEENQTEESQKNSNRNRLSDEDLLFVTEKANRPGTVFHWVQSMVAENGGVAGGSGMPVAKAVDYMLNNFEPKKSQNFGKTYCRAYVNGGVTEGHLTTDRTTAASEQQVKEPKSPAASTAKGGSGLTKSGKEALDKLVSVIDEDEYESSADVITVKQLAESLEKPVAGVSRTLSSLEKNGFVTVTEKEVEVQGEGDEEPKNVKVKYVHLTEDGWNSGQAA